VALLSLQNTTRNLT